MTSRKPTIIMIYAMLLGVGAGLTACKEKGPVEQFGEEVDEAVDTAKRGEESTATKVDDAADELRSGVNDAADELKDK